MSALDNVIKRQEQYDGRTAGGRDAKSARAELAALRASLATVTAERDTIKLDLFSANQTIESLKNRVEILADEVIKLDGITAERDAAREALKMYERKKALRQ